MPASAGTGLRLPSSQDSANVFPMTPTAAVRAINTPVPGVEDTSELERTVPYESPLLVASSAETNLEPRS
eukprot:9112294-Alexandrium_andersonii.AAC.1